MNLDDYNNKLTYPDAADFTKTYFYSQGEVVGCARNQAEYFALKTQNPNALTDKTMDLVAYNAARDAFDDESRRLANKFKTDLFAEEGVPMNDFTNRLYVIAYDRGHYAGYSEVASCFSDMSDLHDIAKRVYGK